MVYRNTPLAPGVAFVTGGFRGLGNAVAVAFAKEGARAVVLVDVNDEETMNAGKKAVEAYGAEARIFNHYPHQ
jgi:NAD(P)-dependent dehydrogenase (short-subunit alcohol dehydrogenase family)